MGIINTLFGDNNNNKKENYVSDALPYKQILEDGTVFIKDGTIMKVWRVVYPDASLSPGRADRIAMDVDTFFRRKEESQAERKTAYWFIAARIPVNLKNDPEKTGLSYMNPGAKEVELKRQENFFGKGSMKNVCYACASCSVNYNSTQMKITETSMLQAQDFFASFETLLESFRTYLVPLEVRAKDPLSDIFNFLKYVCGDGDFYSYKSPLPGTVKSDISKIISDKAITKGRPMLLGKKYVQVLTINNFPDETEPDILLRLLSLPFKFRFTTRWIPMENWSSLQFAKKKRKAFLSNQKSMRSTYYELSTGLPSQTKETQAVVDTENVEDLMEQLARGEVLGFLTTTITLYDDTVDGIVKKVKAVSVALQQEGFAAVEESVFQNYFAWKSTLPGDTESGSRKIPVKAMNFAHIVPFTDLYRGFEINTTLKRLTGVGYPLALGKIFTGEIFNFNLNPPGSQLGHFFCIGSTGGGKSVFLSLIASQFSRYPNTRVVFFDKDLSFANICRRDGGSIYIPASEETPLHFSPLSQMKDFPERACAWLETVVDSAGTEVTADITSDFMHIIMNWGYSYPTVSEFYQRLNGYNPSSPALLPLRKLIDNPKLNALFCGDKDEFTYKSFAKTTMIEMGALMELDQIAGNVAVIPTLQFMFDRIDELFDKEPAPTLLIMDEAWVFLNNKAFRAKIKEWLKTLRKKNVYVGFALQNINDIDDPEEFLTSCPTAIYLPNEHLKGEEDTKIRHAYEQMGLTGPEIGLLADYAGRHTYLIKQHEGTAMVDFCIDKYQLERLARDGY